MTITLELPPETESRLRQVVARRDAESLRCLLAEAVAPTVEALLAEPPEPRLSNEEFNALLDELAKCAGDVPTLSDYAVSREDIYGDHP